MRREGEGINKKQVCTCSRVFERRGEEARCKPYDVIIKSWGVGTGGCECYAEREL